MNQWSTEQIEWIIDWYTDISFCISAFVYQRDSFQTPQFKSVERCIFGIGIGL